MHVLFQSDTGAAESSTENTEVQKRSMNRVAKETPTLTTGLKEGAASWESGDCRAPGGSVFACASLELREPMTGLERRGIRLSLPVWVWPSRQMKVPNVLYQRRKPKRTDRLGVEETGEMKSPALSLNLSL